MVTKSIQSAKNYIYSSNTEFILIKNKFMRVLHVYRTYFPDAQGGLQEAIRQICIACGGYGIESKVFVLSPNPNPTTITAKEGQIVRSRSWLAPASCDLGGVDSFHQFNQLAKWADIIHFHFPWPYADVLNLISGHKKPTLLTYHSDIVKQKIANAFYAPLRTHMLNSMDAIVATSPVYADSSPVLKKYLGSPKLKMIPLGIVENQEADNDPISEEAYLKKLNLHQKPYLLFLGVLRYYKGLHTLVQAAKSIESTIVIAGAGPEELSLKKQVSEMGISNIIFTGEVTEDQKNTLLKRCYALVLPSHLRSEAFGMVLIEASMHSKPMISCEIKSGTSYANHHNQTGYVVAPENPSQLAQAVNALFSNVQQARTFGENARKRYEELFSGPALGKAYSSLYKEILNKRIS